MKRLPLKTVMNSLRIVTLECGYELHNAAGTAKYDAWGVREEVHGVPEYFPVSISLKGPDFAAPDTNESSPEKITEPSLGDLLEMQKAIADQLDCFRGRWEQKLGTSSEGKVPVVMLGDRYVAIGGGYTPEEISDAVEHIKHRRLTKELGKELADLSPFAIEDGKVFIKEAMISDADTTASSLMKVKRDENGRLYAAGMGVAVEDGDKKVRFLADKFEVNKSGSLQLNNAIATAAEFKIRLSDEMREAVIDAIRESDVFKALLVSQDAQASAQVTLQQTINQVVTDAIRNAVKPGGLLFGKR
ncbi:DUF1983 domain-containing protein [Pseudescherichia sp.]|uniref:phage tail tip fiber protein n=1 Tax=Pseudescherichia sp. TaxID=2055881 RepID=UPI00289F44BB|nr:hypothetical protein [Pseudescherichia sp.]